MRDDEEMTAADVDEQAEETERAVATLIAGGLLGAAIGAGIGLLASRAAAPPPPLPLARPRRAVARTRRELDDLAGRVERELRELRRVVLRQRRRGWLR
jgi:hypothetical protein